DDRVERRLLTKVDARLVLAKHTSARDARLDELGHAVRRTMLAGRRNDAETVRVDEGLVVAAVAATSVGRVDLAHRDDRVLHLDVNLITVNIEVVGKGVVLADLLELAERVRHARGVKDSDARRRLRVAAELAGLGIRRRR